MEVEQDMEEREVVEEERVMSKCVFSFHQILVSPFSSVTFLSIILSNTHTPRDQGLVHSPHKREDRGSSPRPGGNNLGLFPFTCSPCSPSSE